MSLKLAFNTTDAPVVIDGYPIDGRGWGPYDSTDEDAKRLIGDGTLLEVDEGTAAASGNDGVMAAISALLRRRQLIEDAEAQSKDDLIADLDPDIAATLPIGGDGKPSKADLVEEVVAEEIAGDDTPSEDASTETPTKTTRRRSGQN